MKWKRAVAVLLAVLLIPIVILLLYVVYDELRISRLHPGMTLVDAVKIMGRAHLDLSPVPADFLFHEPPRCGDARPERLLVYYRSAMRSSILVYGSRSGEVQCVVRRGFMIIAH